MGTRAEHVSESDGWLISHVRNKLPQPETFLTDQRVTKVGLLGEVCG